MTRALEILVLAAGAIAMLLAIPAAAAQQPRVRKRRLRPAPPVDLERLERLVPSGHATAGDVHIRLRPVLREIARGRLSRRRVRLDGDPDAARRLLGEELWDVVRPDRRRPEDMRAPALSREQLAAMIARLEEL
jgi:hypothetical protein